MQKFTQKYSIAQLLEPMKEGEVLDAADLPQHVTIAEVFAVDWDKRTFVRKAADSLSHCRPVRTIVGEEAIFGGPNRVRVQLLELNHELFELHKKVVRFLETGNVRFNSPEYTMYGYRPHITVRSRQRLHRGDIVQIDTLALIDMFPNRNHEKRKVLQLIDLGK